VLLVEQLVLASLLFCILVRKGEAAQPGSIGGAQKWAAFHAHGG
jgi:hypothetical protein